MESVFVWAIVACVIIGVLFVYRQRLKFTIKGPLNTQFDLDASNDSSSEPSAATKTAKSDVQSERFEERRERADLALLTKLWELISWDYVNSLDYQTQIEMIYQSAYYDHIVKYLQLRSQPQNRFHLPELEQAFSEFDKVLSQFDTSMQLTYTMYIPKPGQLGFDPKQSEENQIWLISAKREAHFDGVWLSDEQYARIRQAYDKLVDQSIALVEQSEKLTQIVHSLKPDFFIDK